MRALRKLKKSLFWLSRMERLNNKIGDKQQEAFAEINIRTNQVQDEILSGDYVSAMEINKKIDVLRSNLRAYKKAHKNMRKIFIIRSIA